MTDDITKELEDIIAGKKTPIMKEGEKWRAVVERVKEALNSPKGIQLSLKLKVKDDFTYIIYQGLYDNVWGRITRGKIIIYNARLGRLLMAHPATKNLLLEGENRT